MNPRSLARFSACSIVLLVTAVLAAGNDEGLPNVVLILADDLGYGELGCYGQRRIRTPNIDRLAREGMRFTQAYSGSPVCAPSRCVLLTGLHTGHAAVRANWENGGWGPDQPEGQFPLAPGTRTLATILAERGYRTAAIGKWGLGGPGTTGAPEHQGFDRFFGYLCQRKAHNFYPTHLWRDGERVALAGNAYFAAHQRLEAPLASVDEYRDRYTAAHYAPDLMIEEALEFVRDTAEHPFFLYFASPLPHVALQVPATEVEAYPPGWDEAPYLGQKGYLPHASPRRAYAGMIARLDRDVGRLLALLDELELAENTLVVFTSDNGPTYAGGVDAEFFGSAGGLRGLKGSLFEGGIRVPLLARWPGHVAPGSASDHALCFQDVFATILALAGAEPEADGDGVSFAPALLERGQQPTPPYLYWEYGGQQALRTGRWKALRRHLKRGDLTLELYDLARDPAESTNVAADHPEVAARLADLLAEAHVPSDDFPLPTVDRER